MLELYSTKLSNIFLERGFGMGGVHFFSFKVDPFRPEEKQFDRVAPSESVYIPLIWNVGWGHLICFQDMLYGPFLYNMVLLTLAC